MHDPCTPVMAKYLVVTRRMQGLVFMVRFYCFVSKFRRWDIFFFCLLPLVGLDKYAD